VYQADRRTTHPERTRSEGTSTVCIHQSYHTDSPIVAPYSLTKCKVSPFCRRRNGPVFERHRHLAVPANLRCPSSCQSPPHRCDKHQSLPPHHRSRSRHNSLMSFSKSRKRLHWSMPL